jgi:hypothetical protein
VSRHMRRTSISIGLNCITNISIKPATSRLRGVHPPISPHTPSSSQKPAYVARCSNACTLLA